MGQQDPADIEAATRHARAMLATGTDDATALAYGAFVFDLLVGDHKTARGIVDRALALNPNAAQAFTISAALHSFADQFDDAIADAECSIRLSPFDQMRTIALTAISRSYYWTGRFDDAVSAVNQAIAARTNFMPAFVWLAADYLRVGRPAEARETARHLMDMAPDFRGAVRNTIRFVPAKDGDSVISALREAGLPE